ncbi:MAG: hypothetical protein LBS91_06460 [Clostridiales Family XIII bacterium]|jgi:hypothetical protein|nr:hypothetical protein [Clostridiales Family XIII bacterium]
MGMPKELDTPEAFVATAVLAVCLIVALAVISNAMDAAAARKRRAAIARAREYKTAELDRRRCECRKMMGGRR